MATVTQSDIDRFASKLKIADPQGKIRDLLSNLIQPIKHGAATTVSGNVGIPAALALSHGFLSREKPIKEKAKKTPPSALAKSLGLELSASMAGNIPELTKNLPAAEILNVYRGMMDELNDTVKDLTESQGFAKEDIEGITEGIKSGVEKSFAEFFKSEEGKKVVHNIVEPAEEVRTKHAKTAWDSIKKYIIGTVTGTFEKVKDEIRGDWEELKDEVKSDWDEILGPKIKALYDGIVNTIKTAFSWLDPVKKFFKDKFLPGLKKLLTGIGLPLFGGKGGGIVDSVLAAGGDVATGAIGGAVGATATGAAGGAAAAGTGIGLASGGALVAGGALTAAGIGAAFYLLAGDLKEAYKDIPKSIDNMKKTFKDGMAEYWGPGSILWSLWNTIGGWKDKALGWATRTFGGGKDWQQTIQTMGGGWGDLATVAKPLNDNIQASLDKSIQAAQAGAIVARNCGDLVAKVLNPALAAAGGGQLLETGGLGMDAARRMSEAYGSKLITDQNAFTAENMSKMTVGTFMVGGISSSQSHGQMVAIDPATGEKGILSQGPGPPHFKTFKEAEADIKRAGWNNWTATNPFEGIQGAFKPEVLPPGSVNIPGDPRYNISKRQNNPFNLKDVGQAGSLGTGTQGYAIFASPEAGYLAGLEQIKRDQMRNLTLGQFTTKYYGKDVPGLNKYQANVQRILGMPLDKPIQDIPTSVLGAGIAQAESSTKISSVKLAERDKMKSAANIQTQQLAEQQKQTTAIENMKKQQIAPEGAAGNTTNIIAPRSTTQNQQSQEDLFGFSSDFYAQIIGLSLSCLSA